MGDLIERLRTELVSANKHGDPDLADLLRDTLAALEAAREDGDRLAWLEREAEVGIRLHNGDFNGRHVGLGLTVWNTRRTLRQAIDQARGKAGQEVG